MREPKHKRMLDNPDHAGAGPLPGRATRRLLAISLGGALLSCVASAASGGGEPSEQPNRQPASAQGASPMASASVLSLDGEWLLAVDPQNVGREQKWCDGPAAQAKPARVPWIIQEAFPGYHGVAWYWRDFVAPANPHVQGRYLLRFRAVDYLAEVWLNGVRVGGHEGSEGVFVLDVTDAIKAGENNRLAVRVLNPTNEPIDDIRLGTIPRRCKVIPFSAGALYDDGGIVDSVELMIAPVVRLEDLWVRPNWTNGVVSVQATVRNAGRESARGRLALTAGPAGSGETLATAELEREFKPGETLLESRLEIKQPHLWDLNDPYLYRVTGKVWIDQSPSFDELSTRCGFKDFRFDHGCFRLNGRRIFLKCSHTSTHYPIGLHWPHDPDLARRDLLYAKVMGFNAIRFFCSVPTRYQIDLCDEIGLMIYEESFAGWFLEDSPRMGERFDREISEMIRRDRNHPCVAMWGLLNETVDGPVFRHAVGLLPFVRSLDDTRIVMLNSGRSDGRQSGGGGMAGSMAGLSWWRTEDNQDPNVTFNGTKNPISALGITWGAGRLALHPGPQGEYCVLRWTAPSGGVCSISAAFDGIAQEATTDVHVLQNANRLYDGFINLNGAGNEASFAKTLSFEAGDTLDVAVGWGNGSHGGDCTGVAVAITNAHGKTYDAALDFAATHNPNGPWSYGFLKPGPSPDRSTFRAYSLGETIPSGGPRRSDIGSLSNPGSAVWEDVVNDQHPYKRVPHTAGIIRELRTASGGPNPVFISEYGVGSGVDLAQVTRNFEQLGKEGVEDAQWYRERLNRFMVDWERWRMADTFASPEDFFRRCLAKMGAQRLLGLNAIRANPAVIGHSMTGTGDQANCGEGLFTTWRVLKPGTVDCVIDGWAPLRWCLFVEPVNVYRGKPVRFEAVLANEDVLKAGDYPVRVEIADPSARPVFQRAITVNIPEPHGQPEPAFALPAFSQAVTIDGPPGKYRFLVTFEKGAAAVGGEAEFYLADAAEMPAVAADVVLWGEAPDLAKWLEEHRIRARRFSPDAPTGREVILAGNKAPAPGGAEVWQELARRMARGSAVVFLSADVFKKGDQSAGWVPLANKGALSVLPSWIYHKDEWSKRHPVFEGLPCGGLMDYTFFREIISDFAWVGQDPPAEVVAAATNTSQDYSAGLTVAVYHFGAGRFILNTLLIRENLSSNPVAERLLRNMLNCAARDQQKPLADVPLDFDTQLKTLGYK